MNLERVFNLLLFCASLYIIIAVTFTSGQRTGGGGGRNIDGGRGSSRCLTNGGKNPFAPCVFPFTYDGVTYFGCPKDLFEADKRWCSTKTDSKGNHVTGQNEYGFCSPNCPVHNQGADGCTVEGQSCRSVAQCSAQLNQDELTDSAGGCVQSDGSPGLCCSGNQGQGAQVSTGGGGSPSGVVNPAILEGGGISVAQDGEEARRTVDFGGFSNSVVSRASRFGQDFAFNVTRRSRGRVNLRPGGRAAPINTPGTAEYEHFRFQRQSQGVDSLNRIAIGSMFTAKTLREGLALRGEDLDVTAVVFGNADTKDTFLSRECPATPRCNPNAKFRTIDGSCNNLRNPKAGMSFTPVQRVLPNAYADGLFEPRVLSRSGKPLPSGRVVTNKVLGNEEVPDPDFTAMLVAFGQFLDHDIDHIPFQRAEDGEGIECCDEEGGFREPETEEEKVFCFPIEVPAGDDAIPTPGFRKPGCINFVRSVSAPTTSCQPGPLEQINQITHWLDSSNVYGSLEEVAKSLRQFKDGLMRTSLVRGQEFLPIDPEEVCRGKTQQCALGGDLRVNEQPTLGAMHILFLREHNCIARELKRLNSRGGGGKIWNDERLYQEAKRINNAQWQHIVFNEFLPVVLGNRFMRTFGLLPLTSGFSDDYSANFDASVTNPFAVAAFRVGHTWINSVIKTLTKIFRDFGGSVNLADVFSDGDFLRERSVFEAVLSGITRQPSEFQDNNFAEEVIDRLFDDGEMGFDLVAINLQRGRDHGIPGYTNYRQICRVSGEQRKARRFSDLRSNISPDRIKLLRAAYADVADIDLFIGMVMEEPVKGAIVGETFLCLIGDTFARLKKGDRFFYDLRGQSGSFSADQLDEIRKVSLARLICDNTEIPQIQPLVMRLPNKSNPLTRCDSSLLFKGIPKVDLSVFEERQRSGSRG